MVWACSAGKPGWFSQIEEAMLLIGRGFTRQKAGYQVDMILHNFVLRHWLYNLVAWYSLHVQNEASQVQTAICSTKKWKMIYQAAIFIKRYPDTQAYS